MNSSMRIVQVVFLLICVCFAGHAQTTSEQARVAYRAAEAASEQGRFAEAVEQLDKAVRLLGKTNIRIQPLLIECLFKVKDYVRALKEIETYLTLNPDKNLAEYHDIKRLEGDAKKALEEDERKYKACVQSRNSRDCEAYLHAYPFGLHKNDVRTLLDRVSSEEAATRRVREWEDAQSKLDTARKNLSSAGEAREKAHAKATNAANLVRESFAAKEDMGKYSFYSQYLNAGMKDVSGWIYKNWAAGDKQERLIFEFQYSDIKEIDESWNSEFKVDSVTIRFKNAVAFEFVEGPESRPTKKEKRTKLSLELIRNRNFKDYEQGVEALRDLGKRYSDYEDRADASITAASEVLKAIQELEALPAPEERKFRICIENTSGKSLFVAIRYRNLHKIWHTAGWWEIPPSGRVNTDTFTDNLFYLFGEKGAVKFDGTGREGSVTLAVVSSKFDYPEYFCEKAGKTRRESFFKAKYEEVGADFVCRIGPE